MNRVALYLSIDMGQGDRVKDVREQLDGFEKRMKQHPDERYVQLYCDLIADEIVPDFGEELNRCIDAVIRWAKKHYVPCKPAVSIRQNKERREREGYAG